MKAVATALVLIAGAAVVLWYGNTLNSWVLGGLIGGLAALLLSIPISLMIFSYLSRRHDEQLRLEEQDEVSLTQLYGYPDAPHGLEEYVDEDGYVLAEEECEWKDDYDRIPESQRYPSPSMRRLPAPKRSVTAYDISTRDKKDTTARQKTTRRLQYPGPSSTEINLSRSQHQSAALRAARKEAAQQYDDEILPAHYPKRPVRVRQKPAVQPERTTMRHAIPPEEEPQMPQRFPRRRSAQHLSSADYRYQQNLHLGPVEESMQTGHMMRQSQYFEEEEQDIDMESDNLKKPLVRRAPYMYEDDPLRQELSQHVNAPIVRRSTRLQKHEDQ